jgi:hypothetical protein
VAWIWVDRLAEVWAPTGRVGSGVVVGTCGVLTARHVVRAAANGPRADSVRARVIRRRLRSPWVPMRLAGEDATWDLAVLRVDQESPEAAGWIRPASVSPVVVAVGASPARHCESVGFPNEDVHRLDPSDPSGWVRQSEQLTGTLLPMGQVWPPDLLSATLPREWMPLDAEGAVPEVPPKGRGAREGTPSEDRSGWSGMSGAGVVLPDGRLAGIAVAADPRHQQRRLYVVPLASALAQSEKLATALADVAGAPVPVETLLAPRYRRLLHDDTLRPDGSPLCLDEVADLGVLGVKPADLLGEPAYLTYVPRDDDSRLRRKLQETEAARQMLLVVGDAGSGKTRSAAQAVRARCGSYRLLRPVPGQLAELVDLPLADLVPAVVWLDDVEEYQHSALAATLRRLLGAGLVVVGTIRRAEYQELTRADDSPAELHNPVGEALSDERQVRLVGWRREWSPSERGRALDLLTNPSAREAVRNDVSLSVWVVAGQDLVRTLVSAREDREHPCRYALVRAVLDWHRTGLTGPIPWSVVVDLVNRAYVDRRASDEDLNEAVGWATRTLDVGGGRGHHSLLVRHQQTPAVIMSPHDTLTANDYLEDDDRRRSLPPVPDATWSAAVANAPNSDALWSIAFTAHFESRVAVEQLAMEALARAGDVGAMVNLWLLLRDRDQAEAREWLRRADVGDSHSTGDLWLPKAQSIGEVAYRLWEAEGRLHGRVNLWVASEKYVTRLVELATKVNAGLDDLMRVFSPEAYFRKVQDLAEAMSRRAGAQAAVTDPLDFWVAAERHLLAMLEGVAAAARTLQDAARHATKILELSNDDYLNAIENGAYRTWEGAGRPSGAGLAHWLETEQAILAGIRERIADSPVAPDPGPTPSSPLG